MPFGLSAGEMIVLFLVAVLVFGGKLPEVARNVGRTLAELKRGWHREVSEFERIDGPATASSASNAPPASNTGAAAPETEPPETQPDEYREREPGSAEPDDGDRPPPGWVPPPDGEDCPGL